ncbi:MAG: metallophosphoesterase [Actinomycetota bacterium]
MLPLLVTLIALGVACVAWGVVIERSWYRLQRYRLAILPASTVALTVLHLSDLHFVRSDAKKARFLASLPAADLTVITGDFLAESRAVEAAVEAVGPVQGRLASWFVLGSNDYYEPAPLNYLEYFKIRRRARVGIRGRSSDLVGGLTAGGWEDLTNVRRDVRVGDLDVELLGLDDAHITRADLRIVPRAAPERFGIAVMHSPDSAPEAAAAGYDLVLAGHTHGGQVCLPFLGALVTNCSMPRRLVDGLIRMGPAILHTSRGLGTSKFAPFRFWCRPTATILDLVPRPPQDTPATLASPRDVAQLGSAQRSGR